MSAKVVFGRNAPDDAARSVTVRIVPLPVSSVAMLLPGDKVPGSPAAPLTMVFESGADGALWP